MLSVCTRAARTRRSPPAHHLPLTTSRSSSSQVLWLTSLIVTIVFIVVLYFAILLPVMMNSGTPKDPELVYAPWSREASLIGLSDDELMYWANICFQVCTALFSYLNGIAIPWRVSILCHMYLSKRSSAPGHDFYGRPTDAIWFQIPTWWRKFIASCLFLSVFFHFATQITRLVWTDYIGSNDPGDGMIPVNATFILSIVFAICAGVAQGKQEKKLMKADPEKYPPGLGKAAKDLIGAWKRGELKLCSFKAIREFRRISKEEQAKFHVASQLERMTTEYIPSARQASARQLDPSRTATPAPSPADANAPKPDAKARPRTIQFAEP